MRVGWAWLEALGARMGPERTLEFQRVARHVHPPSAIAAMSLIVEAQGTLRSGTVIAGVERAGDGWRATLRRADGTEESIASRALVLATGGFQNHPGLVREYLGIDPALLWERNSGLSDGAGLRLGQACGAGLAGGLDTFYGHCLAGAAGALHEARHHPDDPVLRAVGRRAERRGPPLHG